MISALRGEAEALAAVYVAVEGVPGFGAEPGVTHYVDAVYGVGLGLFLFDGDFPEPDYLADGGLEAGCGKDPVELALEGVYLSAGGG